MEWPRNFIAQFYNAILYRIFIVHFLYRIFIPQFYTAFLYRNFIPQFYAALFIPQFYTAFLYRNFIPQFYAALFIPQFYTAFCIPQSVYRIFEWIKGPALEYFRLFRKSDTNLINMSLTDVPGCSGSDSQHPFLFKKKKLSHFRNLSEKENVETATKEGFDENDKGDKRPPFDKVHSSKDLTPASVLGNTIKASMNQRKMGQDRRNRKGTRPKGYDEYKFSPYPMDKEFIRVPIHEDRAVVMKTFLGKPYINIREYYQDKMTGKLLAGKKGINLTRPQWQKLKTAIQQVDQALVEYDVEAMKEGGYTPEDLEKCME